MAHFVSCDGCGKTEQFEYPKTPVTIQKYFVIVTPDDARGYYLCEPCHEDLRKRSDPTQWARPAGQVGSGG